MQHAVRLGRVGWTREAKVTEPALNPRRLLMVDETNLRHFRKRWREIDQLWGACGDPEHWDVVRGLREAARDELRQEMLSVYHVGPRIFAIAI